MKYVNSIFTPDQTGRLGGVVFGKNKFGYYLKTFKPPVNPKSPGQQDVRSFFSAASKAWAAMTSAQITAWNDIAPTISYVKKGITYSLTGFNLFVKLNRNLQDVGQPFYQDISRDTMISPPDLNGSSVAINTTPGTADITLTLPAALDVNTMAIVYATPVLKNSRQPNWKQLRVIGTIDNTFITPGSIKTQYLAKFATMPATGDLVGFSVMPVNITSGLTNSKVYMTAIGAL